MRFIKLLSSSKSVLHYELMIMFCEIGCFKAFNSFFLLCCLGSLICWSVKPQLIFKTTKNRNQNEISSS
ncbi:hypothetical protein DC094_20980 [Pelagibaculum spongiae]|uniref:Uncharacterized protein n=1 Tax=Pelagibaculum spongiae TaxID=2080658 RepID=A0A2V1GWN0_9GAMM|nr:hypothetical protein DC094_20980 [Pelagibaculum spongiae]